MTALSKTALKTLWKAYFQPTSADFSNLIDSWTDYKVGLETLGQAVSAGSVGVPQFISTTTVQFLAVGATGSSLLATNTAASAQSVIGLSGFSLPVSVANGGTGRASLSANHVVLGNGTGAVQLVAPGTTGNVLTSNGTTWSSSALPTQRVLQVVNSQSNAQTTSVSAIPWDNTVPQSSEGTEFLSISITPANVNNKLRIDVTVYGSTSSGNMTAALFQDSGASAIAAVGRNAINTAGGLFPLCLTYYMTAGTISSTTFRVRAGVASGTFYFNHEVSFATLFGGALYSSITVTEISA
jgi:hypothetical protein